MPSVFSWNAPTGTPTIPASLWEVSEPTAGAAEP